MLIVTFTVDPAQTLAEMIAAGNYDSVNPYFKNENFPTPRVESDDSHQTASTEVSLEIVHLNKGTPTEEIEAELDRRGLRPATLLELLALGAKHPEFQREFPLVALGSYCYVDRHRDRYVPYLDTDNGERRLELHWGSPGYRWHEDYRFVAVRT